MDCGRWEERGVTRWRLLARPMSSLALGPADVEARLWTEEPSLPDLNDGGALRGPHPPEETDLQTTSGVQRCLRLLHDVVARQDVAMPQGRERYARRCR